MTLAWSVDHPDEQIRELNHYTIAGIARILADYPMLRVEVHSETGNVRSAPLNLARHLGVDAHADVQACMDSLASNVCGNRVLAPPPGAVVVG